MSKVLKGVIEDIRSLDKRTTIALLTSAFVLITLQFRGRSSYWQGTEYVRGLAQNMAELQFFGQVTWAATTVVLFGVVPFLVATLVLRMRPSEFGFHTRGFVRHLAVYVVFFLIMSPLIWLASKDPAFREAYPFARLAAQSDPLSWGAEGSPHWFWRWQLCYFLQFCALEMFFRGFLIFSLERRFGLHAIFVMTIPYAMIHLHKPMPEAFGAIFAGVILGYMALKTRSFYGGILLHYAVALTMDLLATIKPG
ncbi:MAG: membrane protease YdiL (CAAX protease family) [Planctomycetota bacterium]|jgi:membrane protease YdiL (CAAX protease family)